MQVTCHHFNTISKLWSLKLVTKIIFWKDDGFLVIFVTPLSSQFALRVFDLREREINVTLYRGNIFFYFKNECLHDLIDNEKTQNI